MALVTSMLFQGVRGKFGDVVFKKRRGKTYVEPMPVYNKDRVPTQEELRVRANFAVAVAYPRKVMSTPELKALYKKKVYGRKTVYGIAFRHALKGPVVLEINTDKYKGTRRSKIFIRVEDDVKVVEVKVSIITADGVIVEEGNALLRSNRLFDWTYVARKQNEEIEGCKVIAVAKNLPGNEGMMESVIEVSRKQEMEMDGIEPALDVKL